MKQIQKKFIKNKEIIQKELIIYKITN